jgi:hypothetical protein
VMFRLKNPALCQQVCSMVLAPYLADTEKARLLLSDGTYAKAHKAGRASRSRNGTRFSVQEYMMGLSEEQEGAEEVHGLPHILKSRNSAVFEILSRNWHEEHNV